MAESYQTFMDRMRDDIERNGKMLSDDLPDGFTAEYDTTPITALKMTAYVPASCCQMTDSTGENHCTQLLTGSVAEEPRLVEIRKVGRWRYSLTLKQGWLAWDCPQVFGLERAKRKARKLLADRHDRLAAIVEEWS